MCLKKIVMYESNDGELFRAEKDAELRNKNLAAESVMGKLRLSKEDISIKLKEVSDRNENIKIILNSESDWTNWDERHILLINNELLKQPIKKTIYIKEEGGFGGMKEVVLYTETGPEFTNSNIYLEDKYKIDKEVIDKNELIKKVYYVNKYSKEELLANKVINKEELSKTELRDFTNLFEEIYRKKQGEGRWVRYILSVHEVENQFYAIEWEEGLTESKEDYYSNQPYKAAIETKEVIVKKKVVINLEEK